MNNCQKPLIFLIVFIINVYCNGNREDNLPTSPTPLAEWSVAQKGNILEIAYGTEGDYSQYGALHLNDSYFRLIYGPESGWGTSVILMPSFWEGGVLYQGAPVSYTYQIYGSDLIINANGNISTLNVNFQICIFPPTDDSITSQITVSAFGNINLDDRPGEAFKLVTLSSMHISPSSWDCCQAFANSSPFSLPSEGWIIQPPITGNIFGLEGGTSGWKTNAPTIEVQMDQNVKITGWVTPSNNPNNDNVGFWGALNNFVSTWSYQLISRAPF